MRKFRRVGSGRVKISEMPAHRRQSDGVPTAPEGGRSVNSHVPGHWAAMLGSLCDSATCSVMPDYSGIQFGRSSGVGGSWAVTVRFRSGVGIGILFCRDAGRLSWDSCLFRLDDRGRLELLGGKCSHSRSRSELDCVSSRRWGDVGASS